MNLSSLTLSKVIPYRSSSRFFGHRTQQSNQVYLYFAIDLFFSFDTKFVTFFSLNFLIATRSPCVSFGFRDSKRESKVFDLLDVDRSTNYYGTLDGSMYRQAYTSA